MCRLAAYAGPERCARPLVYGGEHPLVEQSWAPRELLVGSVNADGYGVGWYAEGRPVRLARTDPIWQDPDLERLLETVRSSVVLASLRNATPGIPGGAAAVAPLRRGRHLFVLNGYVEEFRTRFLRSFLADLPDDLFARLVSASDTEVIFLMLLHRLRTAGGLEEALREVIGTIRDAVRAEGREAQLNLLFSDGRRVAATRASSVESTNSLYVARDSRLMPGGTTIASEPLAEEAEWTPVEPQSLVVIDRRGEVRITSI